MKIALLKINNNKLFVLTKIPVSKAILFSFNSGKINPSSKYLETWYIIIHLSEMRMRHRDGGIFQKSQ